MSLMVAGCAPIFAPIRDLPAELAFVVDNKSEFSQTADDPLTQVAGDTAINDLSGLSGCWGSFDVLNLDVNPPEVPDERVRNFLPQTLPLEDIEVYVFDNETQEMSWFLLERDTRGLVTLVQTFTGSFSVTESNRIAFVANEAGFNDPLTGEIVSRESGERFEWLVTLSGDRLKLHAQSSNLSDQVSRDDLVFHRFECP